MPLIFISHSSTDDAFVTQLAADLRAADLPAWVDHEAIGPGDDWDRSIEQALEDASALIVVLTPASVASDEVRSEWRRFIKLHKPVYPIVLQACKVPYRLEQYQWLDFTKSRSAALRRLLKELRQDVPGRPPSPAPEAPPAAARRAITPATARQVAMLRVLSDHRDSVRGVAVSPDGTLLASCGEDKTVRLWHVARRTRIKALIGHEKPVCAVAFSPDGALLASASEDRTVRLWDVAKRYYITALRGHTAGVTGLAWHPLTRLLASCSEDGTVRTWNPAARAQVAQHDLGGGPLGAIAYSADGQRLAALHDGHRLVVWDVARATQTLDYKAPDGLHCLAFSPDGALLALGLQEGGLMLIDSGTGARAGAVFYADYNANCVRGVAFSPDGALLAMASLDGAIRLWKVAALTGGTSGRALRALEAHEGGVTGVAFSADGALLASSSHDGTLRVWGVGSQGV